MYRDIGPALAAAVSFSIHVIMAGLLFGLIVVVAAGLFYVTYVLQNMGLLPAWILVAMKGLEAFAFIVDGICFAWLIAMEGYKFCLKIWAARNEVEAPHARSS